MSSNGALLSLRGVTKRFGAVQALGGVDFEVRGGRGGRASWATTARASPRS